VSSDHVDLQHVTLERERIVLRKSKLVQFLTDCRLIDCTLTSYCDSRGFSLARSSLIGGCFEQCTALSNFDFRDVLLEGVVFIGEFDAVRFGSWKETCGSVSACDFRRARLHQCSFYRTPLDSLQFAPWPTFVLGPDQFLSAQFQAQNPSKEMQRWMRLLDMDETARRREISGYAFDALRVHSEDGVPLEELMRFSKYFHHSNPQ
jgi:hypothetical protein